MSADRVQKILAQAGITSRRKAEDLIRDGQVTINGKIAQLGDKAEWGKDAIKVKGKLLQHAESPVYIAFYKPKGVISALVDPDGRATLKEFLGKIHARVFPVGRLDFNSEGLILLTNDGAFSAQLQKCDEVPRVYQVKVRGHIDDEMLARIHRGAWVEKPVGDGTFKAKKKLKPHLAWIESKLQSKTQINVVIMGGGAFDIKKLFETTGFLVEKITRTAIGHITLHGLTPGKYRLLKGSQVQALITQPELGMRELPTENPRPRPSEAIAAVRPSERPSFRSSERGGSTGRSDRSPIRPARDSSERSPIRSSRDSSGRSAERSSGRPSFSSERSSIRPAKSLGRSPIRPAAEGSSERSFVRPAKPSSSERSPVRPARSSDYPTVRPSHDSSESSTIRPTKRSFERTRSDSRSTSVDRPQRGPRKPTSRRS
jgi:23S rRNA pseudouridine2605 synthase